MSTNTLAKLSPFSEDPDPEGEIGEPASDEPDGGADDPVSDKPDGAVGDPT
ncbi:hypothetical protein ACFOVU_11515 [Nocardiopsis sediminis]|uniref:Uncharacterized protein n=1 Tax=Nocardiopsis sediminis TaxID=1778267 RepID=A0ABV8FK95_9ACTN